MCIHFPLWLCQFAADHSAGLGVTATIALFIGLRIIIPDNL